MTKRFAGRVAIVTGAASGIGRACATRLAAEGASVIVSDLTDDRGMSTVDSIASEGGTACFVPADISSEQQCESLVETAAQRVGPVDILISAAGILHARYVSGDAATGQRERDEGHVVNKPVEYWEKVLAVNLTGTMLVNRAVARHLLAEGRIGSIVNIASQAAVVPLAGSSDYCVSKAGVWMLTKVLGLELAPHGIRVNAVAPGAIETPMIAATLADEARATRLAGDTPLGRIGQPGDIAGAALYLASDDAAYVTGEIIFATGGRFSH